jgi:hypothetical protein
LPERAAMKKLLPCLCLTLLLPLLPAFSRASDYTVKFGLKSWYAAWTYAYDDTSDKSDHNSLLLGPSVAVVWDNNLFVGANYLSTWISQNRFDISEDFQVSRNDLDFFVGYMLHPRFGVVGGLKRISGKEYDNTEATHGTSDVNAYGYAVGFTGNLPLGTSGFQGYLNGNYMNMVFSFDDRYVYDADGVNVEVGINYTFDERWSANFGYKYQQFKFSGIKKYDIIQGHTLGVAYSY